MLAKTLFATAVAVLSTTALTQAADMARPVPVAPIAERAAQLWTGFYVGAHVGVAHHDGDMTAFTPWNGYAGFPVGGLTDTRVMGGLQAGYNYQMGNIVLGLEATGSLMQIDKWSNENPPRTMFRSAVNWDITVTPRIGYAFDRALVYVKGGLAVAEFEYSHNQNGTIIGATQTRAGWTVGAGLEYALTQNVSLKGEYGYMDFGKSGVDITGAPSIRVEPNRQIHVFTVGMNYRF
jgi:outer membrane immunogenic protein